MPVTPCRARWRPKRISAGRCLTPWIPEAARWPLSPTKTRPRAQPELHPLGVAAASLGPTPRALLAEVVALYLDRLVPELADREANRIAAGDLYFAWEGSPSPGSPHYYRVQGDDLLIEYDNTQDDANHAHTVLRRPRSDFGDDILAAHYGQAHVA
jgi:hypothetical protein